LLPRPRPLFPFLHMFPPNFLGSLIPPPPPRPQPSSYALFSICGKKIVSYPGFLLRTDVGVRNFLRNAFSSLPSYADSLSHTCCFRDSRFIGCVRRIVGCIDFNISITYGFRFLGKNGLKGKNRSYLHLIHIWIIIKHKRGRNAFRTELTASDYEIE